MLPLLLLDVDGVLNILGRPADTSQLRQGFALAPNGFWPITVSVPVVDRLRMWHEEGRVEIQWLTTWGEAANGSLRDLLGWPELDVAGTYQESEEAGETSPDDSSLAGTTPSAPAGSTGSWWKYDVVRNLLQRQPDRRVVWIDDELTRDSPFRSGLTTRADVLVVGPDPQKGLSEEDLDGVEAWLSRASGSGLCRQCGGPLVPLVFGFPGPDLVEAAQRGEVVLGGCVVFDGQPEDACPLCR